METALNQRVYQDEKLVTGTLRIVEWQFRGDLGTDVYAIDRRSDQCPDLSPRVCQSLK